MSEEPVRLVDDPSAPTELRADLTRAADAPPPAFEIDGGLARLSAAIGALPGAGGPSSPGGGSATGAIKGGGALAGAKAGGVLGSGVFWGLTACGVVGAAFVWLAPPRAPQAVVAPPIATQAPTSHVEAPVEPAPSVAAASPTAADEKATNDDGTDPLPRAVHVGAASETKSPARREAADSTNVAPGSNAAAHDAVGDAPAAAPSAVSDEIRDMAALRAAEGDPARALELATTGARRFPGGVFGQEREAVAIDALSRLGRAAEAKSRAEAFVAAHPKSVYVEQVRRAGHL